VVFSLKHQYIAEFSVATQTHSRAMVFYHDVKMANMEAIRLEIIQSMKEAAPGMIARGASVWKRLGMETAISSLSADKMKCGFCESECEAHPAHLMHAAVPALALVPVRGLLSVQAGGVRQSLTVAAVIFGVQDRKNTPLSGIYAEIKSAF
jgi:hypothetical protein